MIETRPTHSILAGCVGAVLAAATAALGGTVWYTLTGVTSDDDTLLVPLPLVLGAMQGAVSYTHLTLPTILRV